MKCDPSNLRLFESIRPIHTAVLWLGLVVAVGHAAQSPAIPGTNEPAPRAPVRLVSQRQVVLDAMKARAGDPWPRGMGHVILAIPGTLEVNKAYHEPGGSFSPGVGSFGVSLWITDPLGAIQATSDSIPLDQLRQQLLWPDPRGIPAIRTQTDYYRTIWSSLGVGAWQLQLHPRTNTETRLALVIRSVGPAGDAIQSLDWNGQRLVINRRWALTCEPLPDAVYLGHEGAPDWTTLISTNRDWRGTDGWGCARIELPGPPDRKVVIRDLTRPPPGGLLFPSTLSTLDVSLPEPQFVASLNAQVAHLMMGLVGHETRPGDPTHYPMNWLRDGAYMVAALARAGQMDVAVALARALAERDFLGGFGPEADAPGLALWALEEVAARWQRPAYDQWLWPHVFRKVQLIEEMLFATRPVRKPILGPIVPQYIGSRDLTLVCEPAQDGLIMGKVDHERPVLYVNAVTYLGLKSATTKAERIGDFIRAQQWRTQAADLRLAWENGFRPPETENERTVTCGLWPSWVAGPAIVPYRRSLEAHWVLTHDEQGHLRTPPLWTYFNVAEAHQWLYLGRPDRVWDTVNWFWQHQASPGLYTWWEGSGEVNPSRLWERVRGWVKPPHVTPHYWTAAEMLLLQLDMLAYLDESTTEPVLVIGGGIPAAWLEHSMHVRGLPIRFGVVDWFWQGGRMNVGLRGRRVPVRLGPSFARNTPLVVR